MSASGWLKYSTFNHHRKKKEEQLPGDEEDGMMLTLTNKSRILEFRDLATRRLNPEEEKE